MSTVPVTRALAVAGIALLAVLGLAVALHGKTPAADEDAMQSTPALTVTVVRPRLQEWPEEIQASGGIDAWQEALIGAEVSGLRLAELLVDVGDEVRKGQLLARFDDATMQALVRQQEAAVAEAEANVAEADANATRAERLGRTGALSQQDIGQYLTRGRTANAQLESARARLHNQRLALQYTRVLAPDDGVISARQATLGSVAAPGAELFRLVRQNRLEWRAELSGAQIARVGAGDRASVRLADGSIVHGTVRQVAPALDARSRVGIAYVALDGGTHSAARPGMYGSGAIATGSSDALTLPFAAIALRDGYEYVFVLQADSRVALRRVDTGRRRGSEVEITAGLEADEHVVASGAAFLADADLVRVVTPATGDAS